MALKQKIGLTSVDTVILLGERVSTDLLGSIQRVMCNAKRIAVGMLFTECGAIPLLSDNTTNLAKSVGKVLDGYEVRCFINFKQFSSSMFYFLFKFAIFGVWHSDFISYFVG